MCIGRWRMLEDSRMSNVSKWCDKARRFLSFINQIRVCTRMPVLAIASIRNACAGAPHIHSDSRFKGIKWLSQRTLHALQTRTQWQILNNVVERRRQLLVWEDGVPAAMAMWRCEDAVLEWRIKRRHSTMNIKREYLYPTLTKWMIY